MFFDRPEVGLKTLLVSVHLQHLGEVSPCTDELVELAHSAGFSVEAVEKVQLRAPHSATYIGKGKVEELSHQIQFNDIGLLILDKDITPSQQRKLEQTLKVRVMTRTELILCLFNERARTHEGKLQVELAQLSHAQSRLVRGWTHLDRQRGGIGLRGVGETQLTIDKRLLRKRIQVTKDRLQQVQQRRTTQRRNRTRSRIPQVALVGYTNVGKSTLFNALTDANAYADDRLFATLDPTTRTVSLPDGNQILLTDTVGFIRDLPVELVAAFRSTLDEVVEADLLLHVVDASDPRHLEASLTVESTLADIGAKGIPTITVVNKIDLVEDYQINRKNTIRVSALQMTGFENLKPQIGAILSGSKRRFHVSLRPEDGKMRSLLYSMNVVENEEHQNDGGIEMTVALSSQHQRELTLNLGLRLHG